MKTKVISSMCVRVAGIIMLGLTKKELEYTRAHIETFPCEEKVTEQTDRQLTVSPMATEYFGT